MILHKSKLRTLFLFALLVSFIACASDPADLVLTNGKIVTADSDFTITEAVAVRGNKIIFVGNKVDVLKYAGETTIIIDLEGKLVIPGLIDSHGHVPSLGTALDNLQFVGTTSYQQIIDMIAEKASTLQPGEWIIGRGWDQNDWDVKEFPTHDALSNVTPDNPVFVRRIDGHAALANAKAMEIAGISASTPDPDGGKIHKKGRGAPTGVFIDNAMALVESKIPEVSEERRREQLQKAADYCLALGVTSVHDAGISTKDVADYKYLIDNGSLGMRAYGMLRSDEPDLVSFFNAQRLENYGDHYLTVRSMKISIDGALGSRGAAMVEDYSDDAGNKGLILTPYDRVLQAARAALQTGFQLNVHAIGDRGNRLVLDAYEKALGENPTEDHRFRIEHAQIVSPEDIPRFAALNVIPAMQATHATSDMYWAEDRVGPDRIKGAYAWRSFLDLGLRIANGSDFPVERVNPMLGLYASITRQDADEWPEGGWYPSQVMNREEMLKSFTIWAAEAAFQEDIIGSIEIGKYADLVVLSKDIMTIEPKEILTTEVEYTITGGKIRYSKN